MAAVDENWQTKRSTIKERTAFLYNNELMSDVKFVVPASNDDSSARKKAKMEIPAHKFVLAISSPVFYAMFYGQMADTTDSVELPDCEYEGLLELLRYMYSDKVNLSGSNIIQVFYLANKYMVPSLADKCTEYMRDNLEGSNVFCILPHAQKFEDKDLEERCWEVVTTEAKEAVTSDEFVTLERSLVETVVKKDKLLVKEVELFRAVDRWATKETERQGLTPGGDMKRKILGEEIVKAIRFPLMSQKEFASVVPDCNILTMKEVVDMMKYYSDVLTTPVPFIQAPRFGPLQWYIRFERASSPPDNAFGFMGSIDANVGIVVSTSKTIFLHGVQLFGSEGGSYKANVDVADFQCGLSLVKQSGTYVSEKHSSRAYYTFDVLFDHAVCLKSGKTYQITSSRYGPWAWRGNSEKPSVEYAGVGFNFSKGDFRFPCNDIPVLIFSLC